MVTQFKIMLIKQMTEIVNALSVMDAPLSEEDRVIYFLASLPESFGLLWRPEQQFHQWML